MKSVIEHLENKGYVNYNPFANDMNRLRYCVSADFHFDLEKYDGMPIDVMPPEDYVNLVVEEVKAQKKGISPIMHIYIGIIAMDSFYYVCVDMSFDELKEAVEWAYDDDEEEIYDAVEEELIFIDELDEEDDDGYYQNIDNED